ncbi:hypothetical protein ACFY1U_18670 [Streptomyces sp. NPDC001351]|uniref:hypothetical protein n=1 Tax=Streptomyces sp. NPDC001351 TaxID=3364564 RepID=UPI0036C83F16
MRSDDPKLLARHLVPLVRPSDVLLAVGPAFDGRDPWAPPQLLLIGPGQPPGGVTATVGAMRWGTYSVAGGDPVRLGFWTSQELSAIAETVDHLALALRVPAVRAHFPHLDLGTRKLLHDLRRGDVLAGASEARVWRERLGLDQLHLYVASIHLRRFAARRRQAESLLENEDVEDAGWMLSECGAELLAALLATAGETNPRRHWHPRLLRLHKETIGADDTARVLRLLRLGPCAAGGADAIRAALREADRIHAGVLRRCPSLPDPSARSATVA